MEITNSVFVLWTVLDNRERASSIWILIFLTWMLSNKLVRSSLFTVIKAFCSKKILIPFLLMLAYTSLFIFVSYKLRIWESYLLKDTIVWVFLIVFTMFLNINNSYSDNNYFKKTMLESIKLTVILEFIVNLYVFNLLIELVLVPVLTILTAMFVVSSTKREFEPIKKLLNYVLAAIGFYLFYYAFTSIFSNFGSFATLRNLKEFILLPILTILYIPPFYFLALYSAYETLFIRVDFLVGSVEHKKSVKWQIFKTSLFNLKKLNSLSANITNFLK